MHGSVDEDVPAEVLAVENHEIFVEGAGGEEEDNYQKVGEERAVLEKVEEGGVSVFLVLVLLFEFLLKFDR